MNTQLVKKNGQTYLECLPDEWQIRSEREALDLVAACGENLTQRLLIHSASLPEDFFQLSTGLAGEVLLKFSNYRIRAAAVIPNERVNQGRFYEMVLETNRGSQFRVYPSREQAEEWLVNI
jgi:PadR family transcriptional regulator, regulatory protein AphA